MSFGAYRQLDIPASAIRAGASTMPRTWQTRGVPTQDGSFKYGDGEPAKSIADIVTAPFRRALATKPHIIATAGLVCMTVVAYLF